MTCNFAKRSAKYMTQIDIVYGHVEKNTQISEFILQSFGKVFKLFLKFCNLYGKFTILICDRPDDVVLFFFK